MQKRIMLSISSILLLLTTTSINAGGFHKITEKPTKKLRSSKFFNKSIAINYTIGTQNRDEKYLTTMSFGVDALKYLNNKSKISYGFLTEMEFTKNANKVVNKTSSFGNLAKIDALFNYDITNNFESYYGIGFVIGNNNHNENEMGTNQTLGVSYNVTSNMALGLECNYNTITNQSKNVMGARLNIKIKY